jgi:hypothetical protein
MKKILSFALPIGIAAFFLWFTYSRDSSFNPKQMWADAQSAHLIPILLTLLTTMTAHLARALRWNLLFQPLGYSPSAGSSFLAVMSGYFGSLIIPRAGEVTRCTALLTSENIPLQTSLGSVIAERGIDLVVFGLLTLGAFGLEYNTLTHFVTDFQAKNGMAASSGSNTKWMIIGAGLVFCLILFLIRKPLLKFSIVVKIFEFAKGLLDGLLSITKLQKPVYFVVLTVVIWTCYFLTTYVSLSIFDFTLDLGLKAAFLLLIIGSFGIILPVPSAVGGPFQAFISAALVFLYSKDSNMSIIAATTMYYSQQIFTLVVGGISYLISVVLANKKIS